MQQDAQVIEAVREGDRERYGELIERYQRLVYGIAWSRLGNTEQSEDVAQETFVQAYRYLATLRRPERFGAWVARIARNMATAMGRRDRREREGLRRWQLEQPSSQPAKAGATEANGPLGEPLDATLHQMLEALPERHRESLVLYYVEGRSQEECASLLGINEGAFRTRLHRARAVLRHDLEHHLADTLTALAPRPELSRRVLAVLPAMPLFTKTLKLSLVGPLVVLLLVFVQFYAYWAMTGWVDRTLAQPCRSEREFWKRALGIRSLAGLLLVPALILGSTWLLGLSNLSLSRMMLNNMLFFVGFGAQLYLMTKFLTPLGLVSSILLTITCLFLWTHFTDQTLPNISMFIFIVSLVLLLSGRLRQPPPPPSQLSQGKGLFRWATQGSPALSDQEAQPMAGAIPTSQLRGFVLLLTQQGLASVASMTLESFFTRVKKIEIFLPRIELPTPAGHRSLARLLPSNPFAAQSCFTSSVVLIRTDGSATARLSRKDQCALQKLKGHPIDKEALERRLAAGIQAALHRFCAGDAPGALRLLGVEVKNEAEAMPLPQRPAPGRRIPPGPPLLWGQWILYGILVVAAFFVCQYGLKMEQWMPGPGKPVRCEDALALLSTWTANADQPGDKGRGMILRALDSHRFPPASTLAPHDRETIKKIALAQLSQARGDLLKMLDQHALLTNSLESGLLSKSDLATIGLTGEVLRRQLAQSTPEARAKVLEPCWPWINGPYASSTWALDYYAQRLSILKTFGCLDLVDVEKMARFVSSHQCPPGVSAEMPRNDAFCPGLFIYRKEMAPFEPTCYSLHILQSLGRLDTIDREACIKQILSFYVGHGQFKSTMKDFLVVNGEDNRYFALESLAILGALDRVRDLKYWKFYYWVPPEESIDPRVGKVDPAYYQLWLVEYCAYTKRLDDLRLQRRAAPKSR